MVRCFGVTLSPCFVFSSLEFIEQKRQPIQKREQFTVGVLVAGDVCGEVIYIFGDMHCVPNNLSVTDEYSQARYSISSNRD